MVGLRESFDVAKRVAILQYVTIMQGQGCRFHELLQLYRLDHQSLLDSLKRYRSDCQDANAIKKMQTGLVRQSSITSLNKYVRIAFELGLLNFEYESSTPIGGVLVPNQVSHVVSSLVGLNSESDTSLHDFELSSEMKYLMFHLLMERDFGYLVPLLFALVDHTEPLGVQDVRKNIVRQYAVHLVTSLETLLNVGRQPIEFVVGIRKRIAKVRKHIAKMDAGRSSHGITHLLDPRLHWLYDLKLVDYEALCSEGVVEPAPFWEIDESKLPDYLLTCVRSKPDIMRRYAKTLRARKRTSSIGSIPSWCAANLSAHYHDLIPIKAVVLMASAKAAGRGKYLSQQEIVSILQEDGHRLYRAYDGTLGYVEIGKQSQQF